MSYSPVSIKAEPIVNRSEPQTPEVAVVTLWRSGWTSVQGAVLDYLLNESFPPDTTYLWVAETGSETEKRLEAAWPRIEARGATLELVIVPAQPIRTNMEKHLWVAALYNEAMTNLRPDELFFVEDDVLPEPGAYSKLRKELSELPAEASALMAAYRSRNAPSCVCAGQFGGMRVQWPNDSRNLDALEVAWMGGGCTLYKASRVLASLPFKLENRRDGIKGWDIKLCEKLRAHGGRVFVSFQVRAEHNCPEVQAWMARLPEVKNTGREEVDRRILPPANVRRGGWEYWDDKYYLGSADNEARRLIDRFNCGNGTRIVDVGCSYGRLATGLMRLLGPLPYIGLDVDSRAINWCDKHIRSKHPEHQFHVLNIYNERYNQEGSAIDESFRFPLASESADIIYLYSVFSHMTEADLCIYLREFRRILDKGGDVFFTAFVEEDVPAFSINPPHYMPWPYSGPLHVVRYEKEHLFGLLRSAGFRIRDFSHRSEADGQSAITICG